MSDHESLHEALKEIDELRAALCLMSSHLVKAEAYARKQLQRRLEAESDAREYQEAHQAMKQRWKDLAMRWANEGVDEWLPDEEYDAFNEVLNGAAFSPHDDTYDPFAILSTQV